MLGDWEVAAAAKVPGPCDHRKVGQFRGEPSLSLRGSLTARSRRGQQSRALFSHQATAFCPWLGADRRAMRPYALFDSKRPQPLREESSSHEEAP
jgi:hypothetical protein